MFTDAVRRFLGRGPEHLTRAQRATTERAYQSPGFRGRRQLARIWAVPRLTREDRPDPKRRQLQKARAEACGRAERERAHLVLRDSRHDQTITRQQRRRAEIVIAKHLARSNGHPWRNVRLAMRGVPLRAA